MKEMTTSMFSIKSMFCSMCEHRTCDFCFVPEFSRFIEKMNDWELCILCSYQTPYRLGDPIDTRQFYVEGAGQLCESCYLSEDR